MVDPGDIRRSVAILFRSICVAASAIDKLKGRCCALGSSAAECGDVQSHLFCLRALRQRRRQAPLRGVSIRVGQDELAAARRRGVLADGARGLSEELAMRAGISQCELSAAPGGVSRAALPLASALARWRGLGFCTGVGPTSSDRRCGTSAVEPANAPL